MIWSGRRLADFGKIFDMCRCYCGWCQRNQTVSALRAIARRSVCTARGDDCAATGLVTLRVKSLVATPMPAHKPSIWAKNVLREFCGQLTG